MKIIYFMQNQNNKHISNSKYLIMLKPNLDKDGNITNLGLKKTLPPGVQSGAAFGHLYVQMGELRWLTYDGLNYLEDYGKGPKVKDLYAQFKFWGDDPNERGIFLKFKNGLKTRKESATDRYKYAINCPEASFEKYIDDMGALAVDFYSVQEGLTIGTSKIIVKLYIKRHKQPGDMAPVVEVRGTFPITLAGNNSVKIGEFDLSIVSSFGNKTSPIPNSNQNLEQLNQNEDFEMDGKDAEYLGNQQKRTQFGNNRIPSSLQNRGADAVGYDHLNFEGRVENERPTRDRPVVDGNQGSKSQLTGKRDLNFGNRKEINIDENEDTFANEGELQNILSRGARLQKQMAEALDPATSAWEQVHGIHETPKPYVPPFLKNEESSNLSPGKMRDKIYDLEVDYEATNPNEESTTQIQPKGKGQQAKVDMDRDHHLEDLPESEADRRQIKDMKFIRVKVKTLRVEAEDLLHELIDKSFDLQIEIPLPDIYQKKINNQMVKLNNYEVLSFNEFGFHSLSLYNFRIDEETLAEYVMSQMTFAIEAHNVAGTLNMNKLIMAHDFKLEACIDLTQTLTQTKSVILPGRKRPQEVTETTQVHAGTLVVEMNLQSGDTEDEMKRNYQIKMQNMEEQRAKAEQEKQEMIRQKMQFVMEQQPVFGQLYLHIDKLGYNDNIGERNQEQQKLAAEAMANQADEEANQDGFGSTLNNRAPGTDEEVKPNTSTDDLERERPPAKEIVAPKRNLFVQFKAFPNLEKLKTNTIWQKDDNARFNYRSQFPVLMCPDALEKMEKFILVLELWDQISPSVQEFLGIVKIPLAPICYSMKTTDDEVYSLNFMADQFCLYPMTVCDGFLPVYSPQLGQDIAHLKVSLHMGSPVQVTRLIQREEEEERRIQIDIEQRKIREAYELKEKEMKEARKAKKEKKRQLEEERRAREDKANENARGSDPLAIFGGMMTETQKDKSNSRGMSPQKLMQQMMRGSMNSQLSKADYDQRKQNMLNCMRKLFEEARTQNIEELNGEDIFKDEIKNFDGTVQKEELVYTLLNSDKFSLTRIEIAQIMSLMLDINRDDQGRVDIDELHFSYKSYIKYYELIEQRVIDMLEKFKLSISKKFELQDLINDFVAEIESKAQDSKLSMVELREIIEDRHGIIIRDAIYDQFMTFFDLDRDQQVYITSLCEYVKMPSSQKINFFKVNSNVIANQISDYVKNSVETCPDCIAKLEDEFKQEIWKNHKLAQQKKRGDDEDEMNLEEPNDIQVIPADLLINENINAKLFQFKLKRMGIALSLWEVFTLFEALNVKNAKMYFEPQRYHQLMFGNFYSFIKNEDYNRNSAKGPQDKRMRSKERRERSRSNNRDQQVYDIGEHGYSYGRKDDDISKDEDSQDRGYWHKNELSDTEDPRKPYKQIKHIFEIKVKELKNMPVLNKFICQSQNQAESNINQSSIFETDPRLQKIAKANANKYIQNVAVKYSFPLDEDEILESDYLQLNREALDQQGVYNYQVSMDTVHTYVLGKEDNLKNVLELCQNRGENSIPNEEHGQMLNSQQARREELFNLSIALFQDNREYIIGNAHLPIEDLIDTILQFENKNGTYDRKEKKTNLNRTLFLYGTTYSQRENCIIGKLQLEVKYSQEKLFLSKREAKAYQDQQKQDNGQNPYSCFMHRETYVNRKIPLNAKLSVLIDRVSHLKESIENIEHFAKIQHSAMGLDLEQQENDDFDFGEQTQTLLNHKLSTSSMVHNSKHNQHLDRRRVLKHILMNGLNLIVRCSVFEEDQQIIKKFENQEVASNFGKYQTRMLFNSLNPVFGEVFEMNLQMDTKIFEYLKNKRAVFEIRHYIIESNKQKLNKLRQSRTAAAGGELNARLLDDEEMSEQTIQDEEVLDQCDYIILGFVRVPLLQLITKNNGVDGDFSIFDEFKQKMGSLRLRITLNHHNSQRPLYSTSNKIPNQVLSNDVQSNQKATLIDQTINLNSAMRLGTITKSAMRREKYILGLNFIELILKNRFALVKQVQGQTQRFYLKFHLFGQNYQSKFIGGDVTQSLSPLNILLQKIHLQRFEIGKTNFIELDLSDQSSIEQAFGKPLEIQLWHKIESSRTYEKPIKEEMLGQFFVELNELPKVTNRRLKGQQAKNLPGKFQVHEGYFSLHETQRDLLSPDRLGMRLYLFNKDDTNETLNVEDMNQIFNLYRPKIEEQIRQKLDVSGKGYTDCEDLVQAVKTQMPDEYLAQKLIWFIKSSLEFKSVDKVFYSPLFGLPPPFFKYAEKFDQLEIICKFNEEIEALDSNDNGFIPVNILKNVLEGELKIKTKIVDDFINGLRDIDIENQNELSHTKIVKEVQSLDANMITNSLKTSHVDYIVLLRKLSQFMDQNRSNNNVSSLTQTRIMDSIKEHEEAKEVSIHFEIDNGMRIKNPISTFETPNTFVYMKPSFQCKEHDKFVQTSQIKSNSYPTWNYRSQNFTMPINQANREWLEGGGNLEFEVFHKAIGASNNLDVEETNHLIGVAFVPLRGLIEGCGKTRITGLYDIVPKDNIYSQSVQSMASLKANEASKGKIKVCASTNLNIRRVMSGEPDDYSGASQSFNVALRQATNSEFNRNVSFGQEYTNNPYPSQKQSIRGTDSIPTDSAAQAAHLDQFDQLKSLPFQQLDASARQYHQDLQQVSDDQLSNLHLSNMSDLDALTKQLKDAMTVLDVQVNSDPVDATGYQQPSSLAKPAPGFGQSTFKAGAAHEYAAPQAHDFAVAQNPFQSVDMDALRAQHASASGDRDDADLARIEPTPAFGAAPEQHEEPAKNIFEHDKEENEEQFDFKEMERIQKILKQQ